MRVAELLETVPYNIILPGITFNMCIYILIVYHLATCNGLLMHNKLLIRNLVLNTALSLVTVRPTTRKTYFPELRFGYVMLNEGENEQENENSCRLNFPNHKLTHSPVR